MIAIIKTYNVSELDLIKIPSHFFHRYVARVDENSPPGTTLIFPDPYIPLVSDDDAGKNGVFSLTLLGNNGTFEISPNVAERRANFLIRVRDASMLDYEMYKSIDFQVNTFEWKMQVNNIFTINAIIFPTDSSSRIRTSN